MRMCQILLGLFLFNATITFASDESKMQLFGGYQLLSQSSGSTYQGGAMAFTIKVYHAWSLNGEMSLLYNRREYRTTRPLIYPSIYFTVKERYHQYSFLLGPRYAKTLGSWVAFGHGMMGMGKRTYFWERIYPDKTVSFGGDYPVSFTTALGGGFDKVLNRRFSLRLAQVDIYLSKFSTSIFPSSTAANFRFSSGLVIKF
jgi:hypothetical protein